MALITAEMLIQNKEKIETKSKEKLKLIINEIGAEMILRAVSFEELLEYKTDEEFIYNASISPNFKDDELIRKLKCELNPIDVVKKCLTRKTIKAISEELLHFSNLTTKHGENIIVKIENDIKNL